MTVASIFSLAASTLFAAASTRRSAGLVAVVLRFLGFVLVAMS